MARFVMAVIVFAMAMVLLKMVIFALIIAGLIFRPKETLGMLLIGGVFALFRVHALLGFGCVALIIACAIYVARHDAKGSALRLPNDASS